jgi:hypothetical protein
MDALSTEQKALRVNLDGDKFGTFAEIGAGQEVVRWFFHVGRASATVAKSISAYDTTVSDDIYGPTDHYVSRHRLEAMLDHEYGLLLNRLDRKRGDKTEFFSFAATVATRSRQSRRGGHGWLGLRFQTEPREEPSDLLVHVQLLDALVSAEQEALGIFGVNLIHSAFYFYRDPGALLDRLMDGLDRRRIEVDTIKFSGPAFARVDNRLMSLQLVERGLTDAAMFTAGGEVLQPSEVLSNKPVLIERGSFRPVTNVTLDMVDSALAQLKSDPRVGGVDPVVLMEMSLHNLMTEQVIDHKDFLARADTLGALGRMVMISNYPRFDQVTSYLRAYTRARIAMVIGLPTLHEVFEEKYYAELGGGILEGLGRLFQGPVKLYIYPMKESEDSPLIGTDGLQVASNLRHLYQHLLENGFIEQIRHVREDQLHVFPGSVLVQIQAGAAGWEELVPAPVAALIKKGGLFGCCAG